jgi:hypothetical protein
MAHLPRDVWIPRFVDHLHALLPAMSEADSIAAAVATYPAAADLDPLEAAERYARQFGTSHPP